MLLEYYLPGYLFIITIGRLLKTDQKHDTHFEFNSIVISVIFRSIIEVLFILANITTSNSLVRIFFMCILSISSAVLLVIIGNTKAVKGMSVNLFHREYHHNFWESVFNLEDGCAVEAVLKDPGMKIIGNFNIMEEQSEDPWIGLSEYCVYKDGKVIQDSSLVPGEHVKLVRLSNVSSISVTDWTKDENT